MQSSFQVTAKVVSDEEEADPDSKLVVAAVMDDTASKR